MQRKCIALLSGGLDSWLAVRIMQEQAVAVEAVTFQMVYSCCSTAAHAAAEDLGVPLTVAVQEDDYFDLVRRPRFGRGRGANPCVDCRIYIFRRAAEYMRRAGADFLVTGEVLGQRPMSQKRKDLETIARHCGAEDRLLRPLSARRLRPTLPEREGWIDRQRLYDFTGRSRKGLIALARQFGRTEIPSPSTGCALTEVGFSQVVFDLLQHRPDAKRWDFELLNVGRHFRYGDAAKVVVARREAECRTLAQMHGRSDAQSSALLTAEGFTGPGALVVGSPAADTLRFAAGLVVRYGRAADAPGAAVRVRLREGNDLFFPAAEISPVGDARSLAATQRAQR